MDLFNRISFSFFSILT